MGMNDEGQGTVSADPTLDAAAAGFTAFLSREENSESRETPPTQKSPASESDDEKKAPEANDSEDEAAESDEESEGNDEEPETSSLDPSTRVRVVIDGQEQEVTLEEALKGYSRTADYTRKTQELSTQRKAQETEFQAVRGERAKYAELMTQLEQVLHENTGPEPDWAKVQLEQPDQFPTMWAQWNQRQNELKTIAGERARAVEASQRDTVEAYQRYVGDEQTKLLDAVPEWKDAEKAKAGKAELVAYAEKAGFSREELAKVADHRLVLLLRNAMLHDKAQAKKPAIVQRIERVKTVTPGSTSASKKSVSESTKARQRLAKTGSIQDAADAFASMLGD